VLLAARILTAVPTTTTHPPPLAVTVTAHPRARAPGKDRTIKQWNADNFEQIVTLEGHHGEIGCSAISSDGKLFVTGSHDRSLRLWERTREMLNPEEEREMEREHAYEQEQEEQEAREARAQGGDAEAARAGKKSAETVLAAEKIMEAIELADKDRDRPVSGCILLSLGSIFWELCMGAG